MLLRLRILKDNIEYDDNLLHTNDDGSWGVQFQEEMEAAFAWVQQGYVLEINRVKCLDIDTQQ